jgi:DNA-binding GntR family transcriptional regulator
MESEGEMSAHQPPEAAIAAIQPLGAPASATVAGDPATDYEPKGEAIARRIRAAILGGQLAPGARIRQEALARQLGVSRIPVREALRQLEAEGLLLLTPHSGARVARLDFDEHLELYQLREALEPVALAESAPRVTPERLDQMRELLDRIDHAADDPLTWLGYDRAFHLASYADAPMPRLLRLIESFWNTTQQYRRAFLLTLDARGIELVNAEHRLILAALERGDATDAEQRQRSHIRRTRVTLMAQADLFDMATAADPAIDQHPSKEPTL